MSQCERSRLVNAYHDCELSDSERLMMAAHLSDCPLCAQDLKQLRQVSRLLTEAHRPRLTADTMKRLHEGVGRAREHMVMRTAEMLTAAAATVLVVCTAWLWQVSGSVESTPVAPWEDTAQTLTADSASDLSPELQVAWELAQEGPHD
jgi:anti-sigma factor RsiW